MNCHRSTGLLNGRRSRLAILPLDRPSQFFFICFSCLHRTKELMLRLSKEVLTVRTIWLFRSVVWAKTSSRLSVRILLVLLKLQVQIQMPTITAWAATTVRATWAATWASAVARASWASAIARASWTAAVARASLFCLGTKKIDQVN